MVASVVLPVAPSVPVFVLLVKGVAVAHILDFVARSLIQAVAQAVPKRDNWLSHTRPLVITS